MLKMVDGTGIIGVDMVCPLGVSAPQPPNYDRVELEGTGMLVLPNSLDAPLERLELGGKTDQFSTKGLNLFNYKDFVDISTYADEGAGYRRKYLQLKPNTSYRMTIFKNRMSPSMDATVMFIGNKEKYDNTAANGKIVLFTSTDKKSATIVTGESGQIVFKLNKNSTPELQEEYLSKADIILSEGSTEIPYEPYTGGKPSPSPEYPQEIKNVGKWNEETQKYEVDVKITNAEQNWSKEQTLTLTSDRPITKWDRLVEQGGQIGWLYATKKHVVTGSEHFISGGVNYYTGSSVDLYFNVMDATGSQGIVKNLSDVPSIWHNKDAEGFRVNGSQFHIRLKNTRLSVSDDATKDEKIAAYKTYLVGEHEKGTPYEIVYQSLEPEFVPLPQSEQNAIRALKTYYPTTVITVDGGEVDPDIKVTYRKEI